MLGPKIPPVNHTFLTFHISRLIVVEPTRSLLQLCIRRTCGAVNVRNRSTRALNGALKPRGPSNRKGRCLKVNAEGRPKKGA